jgi:hypothetical protein
VHVPLRLTFLRITPPAVRIDAFKFSASARVASLWRRGRVVGIATLESTTLRLTTTSSAAARCTSTARGCSGCFARVTCRDHHFGSPAATAAAAALLLLLVVHRVRHGGLAEGVLCDEGGQWEHRERLSMCPALALPSRFALTAGLARSALLWPAVG